VEIVKLLLEYGADVGTLTLDQQREMYAAARSHESRDLEQLLKSAGVWPILGQAMKAAGKA